MREAVAFYDERKDGLGDEFLDEIDGVIERVLLFPKAHTLVGTEIRRIHTKRFPYGLVYKIYQEEIVFIAVMHDRRKPDYWKNRL